jgi:hypothetical protein
MVHAGPLLGPLRPPPTGARTVRFQFCIASFQTFRRLFLQLRNFQLRRGRIYGLRGHDTHCVIWGPSADARRVRRPKRRPQASRAALGGHAGHTGPTERHRLGSSRHGHGGFWLQHRTFNSAGLSRRRLGRGADLEENRISQRGADALGLADGLPRAAYAR